MHTKFLAHRSFLLALNLGLLLAGCAGSRPLNTSAAAPAAWEHVAVKVDTFQVLDPVRQRRIPLATYVSSLGGSRSARLKVALLNHGYGGTNTAYSFLAKNLVAHGYYVVSLQQELPGDAPLPTTGVPAVVRRPNWERGAQNILFVLQELKRTHPELDYQHLLLMGHSNGGDTAALFAQEHPEQVDRLLTFDNRRMPLPRARRPRVLSLRSSDQPADAGVVPSAAEQAKFGITIVPLPATIHNDMWDGATLAQQREMNALVSVFLEK
ncbi:MAG: alpha/beta hydrolase [Hymenobacter sp.]|nr:MAG: alpha/beta hydrolase [Hymenobacter sp.]